ncbi:MAG: ATPase, T2SS/T4P/T4SS family [Patescibacteria group bacterium]
MQVADSDLKKFILASGLISRADVDAAEEEAKDKKTPLKDVLVNRGSIGADDVRRILAHVMGIPFISLTNTKIDVSVLTLIPEPIARTHNIVAFKKNADSLEVAMLDTSDLEAINFIKKKVGLKIVPRLTDIQSIKNVLVQYQKSLKDEFGDIIRAAARDVGTVTDDKGLAKMAEDVPVVKIMDTLLRHAITQGSSDIHIEPMEDKLLVRFRIDGLLHDAMELPSTLTPALTARIKVLSRLKLDEKRLPQDGRFKINADGEEVSFRVSVLPTYYGEKTVMRILREGGGGYTLESLGFHGAGLDRIHDATRQSTGMILVTGPTGSGKTTTLYTVLDIVNTPDVNISTIEDPIEYQMPRVNQTQVRPDIGFTFSQGLRALVRQDPDIIMVGEIRDGETASLAVNAALTGHLVLSTVHTNSAAATIARLMDMGVEPFLLVSTLRVIIGQRLVRKLTGDKEEYTLSAAEIAELEKKMDITRVVDSLRAEGHIPKSGTIKDAKFCRPKAGVDSEDGYKDRVGIHEILAVSHGIRDLILKGTPADDLEAAAKKEGMLTMLEDGIFKAATGVTTIEEVFRVVTE